MGKLCVFILILMISFCVRISNKIVKLYVALIALQYGYLKVDKLEAEANEKFNKVNVSLDNSDPEKTAINFFSQLTTDKPLVRAKVSIFTMTNFNFCFKKLFKFLIVLKASTETPKSEKIFRCGNELLRMNVDLCKMGQIQSTTFAKVLMENFAKTSDFELKCPLTPKNYSLNNFSSV